MNAMKPVSWTLGCGARHLSRKIQKQRLVDDISVVGARCQVGQPRDGTVDGPDILRQLGIIDYIGRTGYGVVDNGDVTEDKSLRGVVRGIRNPEAVGHFCRKLSETIASNGDKFHLTLGGDHSLALGSVHGHATLRPNLKVLWVDAHADINTDKTSPSGNLHGMPVGRLMKGLEDTFRNIPGLEWFERKIAPEDIVYIGLRDVDQGEVETIRRLGIRSFHNSDVHRRGVVPVMEEALALLQPSADQPLHLSFDIDAMDPMLAPSTGTQVPEGLTRDQGLYICQQAARTGALGGMDIVEVNPRLGNKLDVLKTGLLAFDMVGAALGLSLEQVQEAHEEFMAVIPPVTAAYPATRIARLPYDRQPEEEPLRERLARSKRATGE